MKIKCCQCRVTFERAAGHVNRSRSIGAPLYCSMACAGLARRSGMAEAERKARKKAYDAEYRLRDLFALKAKKHEYYLRTRDPEKERAYRKQRMPKHVEYCRRPEYKAWKSEYDANYRASEYGQFAEAYTILLDLEKEIRRQATKYERYVAKGYFTRSAQKRRRELWQAMQQRN